MGYVLTWIDKFAYDFNILSKEKVKNKQQDFAAFRCKILLEIEWHYRQYSQIIITVPNDFLMLNFAQMSKLWHHTDRKKNSKING